VGSLFGRDGALARGRAVLDSAARNHIVRALRVVGPSGVGKTALAETLAQEAQRAGWLVVWTPDFRIHASLPLFTARRVVQSLLEALGESAQRYSSGLTIDRAHADEFREAFLRIVEGVTLDHRLLLVIDDAMWADAESRALIEHTVSTLVDRAIVILSTERSDESEAPAVALSDETIVLDDLMPPAAIEIVRSIFPGVNDDVAAAIVAATRGHAMDVVAVATFARESGARNVKDVSESTRRVVVRDLGLLEPQTRTFLQVAALIDEPIEFSLLTQLWPRDTLLEMISSVSGRYLVEGNDGMRFVHSTVMESVLETIPIEIPLRYRIIDALKALPSPRLEDLERMAAQYSACGDRDAEREVLIKLSEAAAAQSMFSLSVGALERALAIASPKPEELAPTYARLSQTYNILGRELDVVRVCKRAFSEMEAAGASEGIGAIASSLVLAQWHAGLADEAQANLAKYLDMITVEADRANLTGLGEYVSMHRVDVERAADFRRQYGHYEPQAPLFVRIRHEVTNAFLALRVGDETTALAHIKSADKLCETAPPLVGTMAHAVRLFHALRYRGIQAAEQFIEQLPAKQKSPPAMILGAHLLIARGDVSDVDEYVADTLSSQSDSMVERLQLGARYAALAFRGAELDSSAWQAAYRDIAAFEAGERTQTLLPRIVALLVPLSAKSPARARALLARAMSAARSPVDAMHVNYPVLLAYAARAFDARDALETIAAGELWADAAPLDQAHHVLARGVASAALRQSGHVALLEDARERFLALGATYFVALATEALGKHKAAGVDRKPELQKTTRREREIAALVADGMSNREIAEKLVLSERTVEGHIANLFAKVNVNSRTQLATWYMRTTNSVA
jgi:DNA-binding NarL/FixJ family response regulator